MIRIYEYLQMGDILRSLPARVRAQGYSVRPAGSNLPAPQTVRQAGALMGEPATPSDSDALGRAIALRRRSYIFTSSQTSFCPALKSRFRDITMKSELPLAPFLIAGTLLVYLMGVDVTGLSLLLR